MLGVSKQKTWAFALYPNFAVGEFVKNLCHTFPIIGGRQLAAEHGVMMRVLSEKRNALIEDGDSCEDVSDLLLKVIDAPVKKHRWERCHDER